MEKRKNFIKIKKWQFLAQEGSYNANIGTGMRERGRRRRGGFPAEGNSGGEQKKNREESKETA